MVGWLMPYIVTTKRPEPVPGSFHDAMSEAAGLLDDSHRAVAKLEEAHRGVERAVSAAYTDYPEGEGFDFESALAAFEMYLDISEREIPESGGTVGPLPDGTVIEVKVWEDGPMRAWANFYGPASVTSGSSAAEIIDAYNARQGWA